MLYRVFYYKYLKHIPLRKLKELDIWGIVTEKFPYHGYIPIKIKFGPTMAGKIETFDTLAFMCPRPPGADTRKEDYWFH